MRSILLHVCTLHSENILSTDLAHAGQMGHADWQHGSQELYNSPHLVRQSWQLSLSDTDLGSAEECLEMYFTMASATPCRFVELSVTSPVVGVSCVVV